MVGIQVSLILVYMCVLLIKTCDVSTVACSTFGLGGTSNGMRPKLASSARHDVP